MPVYTNKVRYLNLASGLSLAGLGLYDNSVLLFNAGVLGAGYALMRMAGFGRRVVYSAKPVEGPHCEPCTGDDDLPAIARAADATDVGQLIDEMLSQDRYALLLRAQISGNLTAVQRQRARAALERSMCLAPEGEVSLLPVELIVGDDPDPRLVEKRSRTIWVEGYFLDRHLVTNRDYYRFVAAGGYEQMPLWEQEAWPAIMDLVDQSGRPGPRFWRAGRYERGEDHLPVVGVSWYEAAAYARWVGKRLPTDAEWVKTSTWPVAGAGGAATQRKFPWGDAPDRQKANLWGSGFGGLIEVDELPEGSSVNGVRQMIGNVWEWTSDDMHAADDPSRAAGGPRQLHFKSLRGGAFDTYFDSHATSQFQSGDWPLARKHNIGFRCAVGLCDVNVPARPATEVEVPEEVCV